MWPCTSDAPSTDINDWVEFLDCTKEGDRNSLRTQLMTREYVMAIMETAPYIAICDDGSPPNLKNNCVFAKRGSEPFENLAKGATINKRDGGCDLDCIKQFWFGDEERLGHLTFKQQSGGVGSDNYAESGDLYHASGNFYGLHLTFINCGWRHDPSFYKLPSVWIQSRT